MDVHDWEKQYSDAVNLYWMALGYLDCHILERNQRRISGASCVTFKVCETAKHRWTHGLRSPLHAPRC